MCDSGSVLEEEEKQQYREKVHKEVKEMKEEVQEYGEEELEERRQAAADFYRLHSSVPETLERALNLLYVHKNEDLYAHLAEFFLSLSRPSRISRVSGSEVLDCRGLSSIQTTVYCTVRNQERRVSSACVSSSVGPKDRADHVTSALNWIQDLNQDLRDLDPCDQDQVDRILRSGLASRSLELTEAVSRPEDSASSSLSNMAATPASGKKDKGKKAPPDRPLPPADPPEPLVLGCTALGALSLSVAKAGAETKGVPLYQHISELRGKQPVSSLHVPVCLVTLLSCGRSSPGKLHLFEEILVIPKPSLTVRQVVSVAQDLQREALRIISSSAKANPSPVILSDSGAPYISADRPEQPLELLTEACSSLGLTPGSELFFGLSCAGPSLLDYSRGKYEVAAGLLKTPDEMVDLYQALIHKYPSITVLIDPLRGEDSEQWVKLSSLIGRTCSLLSDVTAKTLAPPLPGARGQVIKHLNHVTVSDLIRVSADQAGSVLIGPCYSEPSDSALPDLAVGLGLDFLKLGGLSGAERTSKYNRIISIEEELEEQGRLVFKDKLLPPIFIQKPPQDPGQDQDQNQNQSRSGSSST